MILGYPISIGFRRLTGCQRDPRDRGVTFVIPFDPLRRFKGGIPFFFLFNLLCFCAFCFVESPSPGSHFPLRTTYQTLNESTNYKYPSLIRKVNSKD